VSRFRLKSLWEAQYLSVRAAIDAPLKTITSTQLSWAISGSRSIILPTFGVAAEYALTPHVLLRAAGTGFGLPHRAALWDAEGSISYRRKAWELRGGFKITHFKTSPQKDEYMQGMVDGGFIGIRYHWQ
jgi:hypothetical protein